MRTERVPPLYCILRIKRLNVIIAPSLQNIVLHRDGLCSLYIEFCESLAPEQFFLYTDMQPNSYT